MQHVTTALEITNEESVQRLSNCGDLLDVATADLELLGQDGCALKKFYRSHRQSTHEIQRMIGTGEG